MGQRGLHRPREGQGKPPLTFPSSPSDLIRGPMHTAARPVFMDARAKPEHDEDGVEPYAP
jgi:hypothetical protein